MRASYTRPLPGQARGTTRTHVGALLQVRAVGDPLAELGALQHGDLGLVEERHGLALDRALADPRHHQLDLIGGLEHDVCWVAQGTSGRSGGCCGRVRSA
jgi:hypothetical protein